MSTDTSRTTEIYASPARQLTLLAFGGMSFALAAGLAFNLVPNVPNDAATVTSGYFGMAFFGLCAGVADLAAVGAARSNHHFVAAGLARCPRRR